MKGTILIAFLVSCALLQLCIAEEPVAAASETKPATLIGGLARTAKSAVRRVQEVPQRARQIAGDIINDGPAKVIKDVREIRRPLPVKIIKSILRRLSDVLKRLRGLL